MDIEYATISKAVQVDGFNDLAEARITPAFFNDESNLGIFQWMHSHWIKHRVTPGMDAFAHEYPNETLLETPEPLAYYIEELRQQRQYALLNVALDDIKPFVKDGDADAAIKILAASLEQMHTEVSPLHDEDTNTDSEKWMEYFLTPRPSSYGWPMGFETLDTALRGFQKGQLITLFGLQKRFKSSVLMYMMVSAHKAGARTMFASFEMTNLEQRTRYYALRANVNLGRLQTGKLDRAEKTRFTRMMHSLDGLQPATLVHDPWGTTTVSALAAKINQHRPDVVFVDGTYMMDAEAPGLIPGSSQALTDITRSLKRLALSAEIPIVNTTQALESKARNRNMTLYSIGYSSSFAQDSDVLLALEDIKGEDKEVILRIQAARNCPEKEVRITVDWEHGEIYEMEGGDYTNDDDFGEPARENWS